ncbi:MAG: hypothetical protein WDZ38_02515, partial [Balneolaceae bacterium]
MNTKTKVFFAFAVIFLIGLTSGYMLNNVVSTNDYRFEQNDDPRSDRGDQSRDMSSEEWQERTRNRLARSLNLSDNQREPFFRTMQSYTTDLYQVIRNRRELEHEMIMEHYRGFRDEISAILNEEQLERLDSYLHPDSVRA